MNNNDIHNDDTRNDIQDNGIQDNGIQKENDDKSKQFDLYTEKIVKDHWKTVRKVLKALARIIGSAIVFGAVAGLIMALVYPRVSKLVPYEEETTTRPTVVIPTDSQTYEDLTFIEDTEPATNESDSTQDNGEETTGGENESETGDDKQPSDGQEALSLDDINLLLDDRISAALGAYKPGIEELNSVYNGVRLNIRKIKRSIAKILVSETGDSWDYVSGEKAFGLIVAEDTDYFYILTLKDVVQDKYIAVIFNNGNIAVAQYIMGDTSTNFAVVAVLKEDIADLRPETIKAAVLGNSYVLQQGDPLIIIGNVYGENDMAVYTMAASVSNTYMDTDSNYRLIYTDIDASTSDCGIIANMSGDIVGLILSHKDGTPEKIMAGYGISELKSLIERLVNGKATPYAGIRPRNITYELQGIFGTLKGVYVDSVEADSPAYFAGVQSGDIIFAINEKPINSVMEFQSNMFGIGQGGSMTLNISRPGKDEYRDIEITLILGVEE